jgi:hypothetical protein
LLSGGFYIFILLAILTLVRCTAYAFMGFAANELFDARYTCGDDELAPPRSVPNFNTSYPGGFEGNQVCPLTSGTAFAVNDFDIFDVAELRWIMIACVVAWWFIFTTLAYLALRFVRYTPLPAPPMAEMAADEHEMQEVDLAQYKKQAKKGKKRMDGSYCVLCCVRVSCRAMELTQKC